MFVICMACGPSVAPCERELKVSVPGKNATEGFRATPVPESAIDCGLAGALSEICRVADSTVAAVGENITLNVQLAFGARVARQVVDWEKSAELGPEILVAGRLRVRV